MPSPNNPSTHTHTHTSLSLSDKYHLDAVARLGFADRRPDDHHHVENEGREYVPDGDVTGRWKAVFFDFDGTIADTNGVKDDAFAKIFEACDSDVLRQIMDYHRANGGVSRIAKFRHIYEHILHKELPDSELDDLAARFTALVEDRCIAAGNIPGAMETIRALYEAKVPMFVVSGTPEDELKRIVHARDLDKFFLSVRGSPPPKPLLVSDLLDLHSLSLDARARCLLVGDGSLDQEAARVNGVKFLGVVGKGVNGFGDGVACCYGEVDLHCAPRE